MEDYKPSYLRDYDEMVHNSMIASDYTNSTSEIRVEENQLFYTNFWTKLFGVKKIEYYSQAKQS